MKIAKKDRFFKMIDPETRKEIEVERVIVQTIKPATLYVGFGTVTWKDADDGKELDFSGLVPVDNVPEGVEMILLTCGITHDFLPVKFNHPSVGNYSEAWFAKSDIEVVSGNLGTKVKPVA